MTAGTLTSSAGPALVLRPYQLAAVAGLRQLYVAGHRSVLLQLATGSGKTIVFAVITRSAWSRKRRVLIIVHRRELILQASKKLDWAGVPHGIICAGFAPSPEMPVQICSIQTALRRLADLGDFDFLILDECHHARARSWQTLLAAYPVAKILGVTATPARLDGKGLGSHCGGPFDAIYCGPPIAELIKGDYLSKARYFIPPLRVDLTGVRARGGDYVPAEAAKRVDHPTITGDAVAKYRELADHQPALAFCATVAHAEHVAAQFREAGYRAASVDGETGKAERDRLIAGLGNGEIEVLTSCDLISEGLDVPALGAVILLRPTKSLVLHLQMLGRGMRPAPGKDALVVLDHVGNVRRHGRPDFERSWTLDGAKETPREAGRIRICPECQAANPPDATRCEVCGTRFRICPACSGANKLDATRCEVCGLILPPSLGGIRRPPRLVGGDIVELSPAALLEIQSLSYAQMLARNMSDRELRAYAQARGYSDGWVQRRLWEQQHLTPTERLSRHRAWLENQVAGGNA
jgi:superfamily II DNA or RNA helicase